MLFRNPFKTRTALGFGAATHIGQVRKENQDAFAHIETESQEDRSHLFVVADGMGGHELGSEASRLAVETLRQVFLDHHASLSPEDLLLLAFERANQRIYDRSQQPGVPMVMGTTCTALALIGNRLTMAHAGDSRLYRVTPEGIEQLSTDHTFAEMLRRMGLLTDEAARTHPRRHTLTRAMGVGPELEVELVDLGPLPDAMACYLLCTDGLLVVEEDRIRETLRRHPPEDACRQLIELANERGGPDNVTVVLVHLFAAPRASKSNPSSASCSD